METRYFQKVVGEEKEEVSLWISCRRIVYRYCPWARFEQAQLTNKRSKFALDNQS
jgi:hypothetical protein